MLFEADIMIDADVRVRVATEHRPPVTAFARSDCSMTSRPGQLVATQVRFRKLASGVPIIKAQATTVGDRFYPTEPKWSDWRATPVSRRHPLMAKAHEGGPAASNLPTFTPERSHGTRPTPVAPSRILIYKDFDVSHVASLTAGLRQRGLPVGLLTGARLSDASATIIRGLPRQRLYWLGRLEDRRVGIEAEGVHAALAAELIQKADQSARYKGAVRAEVVRSPGPSARSAT
jgi:hypothetical protein